jgi:hypothetical protein
MGRARRLGCAVRRTCDMQAVGLANRLRSADLQRAHARAVWCGDARAQLQVYGMGTSSGRIGVAEL